MAEEREIIAWYSLKGGKHIPVYKGESKQDAIKRVLSGKDRAKASPKTSRSELKRNSDTKQSKSSYESKQSESKRPSDSGEKKVQEMKSASERADAMNKEQAYRDELAKGKSVTMENGKMMFKGKPVEELDTSDRGTPGNDSLADHVGANGKITPERAEVHRQIIEDYFNGKAGLKEGEAPKDIQPYAPNDERVTMFTGGGGASGKGVFSKKFSEFYSAKKTPLVVDPDEVKKMLAKADGKTLDDKLTAYYHEESSAIAKQIYGTALKNNYPTLYDGTATGGGIYKLKDLAEKLGFKTEMRFVYSDYKTVKQNSLDRYRNTGRLVPLKNVVGAHQKAYDAVQNLQDKFDSFKLYDNAGRNLKLVGEQTGKNKLTIHDSSSYNRFSQSRAEFTLSTDEISNYNREAAAITKELKAKQKK